VQHRTLFHDLMRVGRDLGLRPFGLRALDSLRIEKAYGGWGTEFAQNITPTMCGLDRHVAAGKGDFIGRDAFLRAAEQAPVERLVLLAVDTIDADPRGWEPVWSGDRRVGYVTSGAYGHTVGLSLAMAYVEADALDAALPLEVSVVGDRFPARVLPEPPYDPAGSRLRS
jgi:dimethylglycine dehydrogenase